MSFLQKIFKKKKEDIKDIPRTQKKESVKTAVPEEKKDKKTVSSGEIITGVLRYAHVTEKTSDFSKKNKSVFLVNPGANKTEIMRAVQAKYGVVCEAVNIINSPGKERRRGKQIGWKPGFKKAIITLKKGQSIEIQ